MNRSKRTVTISIAGAAAFALLATGCSASGGGGGSDDGNITLSVTTFGTMGVDANYEKYMDENPTITIEATNLEGGGAARDDAYAKIAAGTGLSDVVAIEEGWLGTIQEVSGSFVDLRDYGIEDVKDEWLDWKYKQGTDADGRVIGAGLDIGPQGICYRGDLFAAAGLPSERGEVAEYFGGADDAAVGIRALLVLPVQPLVRHVFDAVVAQVDERSADLLDGAEPALLDRHDVAQAGARRDLRVGVVAGSAATLEVRGLDGDVGVLLHVLLVVGVDTHGAERRDRQRHLAVVRSAAATGCASGREQGEGCRAGDGYGRGTS